MYSEELKILDRNTVKYMVDQMQEQIDNQKEKIAAQEKEIQMLKRKLEDQIYNIRSETPSYIRKKLICEGVFLLKKRLIYLDYSQ